MNNALMKQLVGLLALGLSASGAHANWDRHDHRGHDWRQSRAYVAEIDTRQANQMRRIHAARDEGALTRREFRHLKHEQRDIDALVQHFLADGRLDRREFVHLDHLLDAAHRNILAVRHDRHAHAEPRRYR